MKEPETDLQRELNDLFSDLICGADRLTLAGARLDKQMRKDLRQERIESGDTNLQAQYLRHAWKETCALLKKHNLT